MKFAQKMTLPRKKYPVGKAYKMIGPFLWPMIAFVLIVCVWVIDFTHNGPGLPFVLFLSGIILGCLWYFFGTRIRDESRIRTLELTEKGIYLTGNGFRYGRMAWHLLKNIQLVKEEYETTIVADVEKHGGVNRWPAGMTGKEKRKIIIPCPSERSPQEFVEELALYYETYTGRTATFSSET